MYNRSALSDMDITHSLKRGRQEKRRTVKDIVVQFS